MNVPATPVIPTPIDSASLVSSPSRSMSGVRKPEATLSTSESLITQSWVGALSKRFFSVAPVDPAVQPQFGGVPPTSQLSSNVARTMVRIAGRTDVRCRRS